MAKKKQEFKQAEMKWQIRGIELLGSSISLPPVSALDVTTFNFQIEVENRLISAEKLASIIVKVKVTGTDPLAQLGSISVNCLYNILNLDEIAIKDGKGILLPAPISDILNSISISTTRGIMFDQFRGTFLHNAILPIIDPKSLQPNIKPGVKVEDATAK